MGVARAVGVERLLREPRHVRGLAADVHRAAAGTVADDGDGIAAQQRSDGRGEAGQVLGDGPAGGAQQALGLLGVARPHVGDLEHRLPHLGRQVGEGRARVEHDDDVGVERRQPGEQRVAGAVEGQREAGDAHEVARTWSRGRERLHADLALGAERRDEGALRARLDHDDADAGVERRGGRGGDGDALRAQSRADQVAVRSGPVGARVHARGAEAGRSDEHGDGAAGVVGRRRGHHVLAAHRQVGHLDDHVDQRLAGVDHPAHASTSARTSSVVARVICGG